MCHLMKEQNTPYEIALPGVGGISNLKLFKPLLIDHSFLNLPDNHQYVSSISVC